MLKERNLEIRIMDTSEMKASPPQPNTTTVSSGFLTGVCWVAVWSILNLISLKKSTIQLGNDMVCSKYSASTEPVWN